MSKLPNAPLIEVIFEIKWDIINNNDIVDFQYFHGDLYSKLKKTYPFRQNLVPPEVPYDVVKGLPVFRFRKSKDEYPLIQVGPGLLTINTIDSVYFWNDLKKEIKRILNIFSEVYPNSHELKLTPILTYLDFFKINFEEQSVTEFVSQNINLNIEQNFIDTKKTSVEDINLTFNYKIEYGTLSLNLRNGNINDSKKGVVLQTKVLGTKAKYSESELITWLNNTHVFSSNVFKNITKGKLYDSFN